MIKHILDRPHSFCGLMQGHLNVRSLQVVIYPSVEFFYCLGLETIFPVVDSAFPKEPLLEVLLLLGFSSYIGKRNVLNLKFINLFR